MGRLTPDEFRKKYAELPPNLREAYGSVKTTEILEEIGKKHELRVDQIGELVDETGYVMLGATPPSDYVMKLEGATGVSREKAKAVAVDVNERVFKAIRDALKRVHKIGGYRDIPPKDMAPPPVETKSETTQKTEEAAPPTEPSAPKEYAPAPPPVPVEETAAKMPLADETPREETPAIRTMTGDMKEAEETPKEETPVPAPPIIERNLSEERLTKTFSLPSEEKTYTVSEDGKELEEEEGVYKIDPYREPAE